MNDREIKFRYVFKHRKDGDFQFSIFTLDKIQNGKAAAIIEASKNDGYELVARDQFSGFHDKNERDLFENDIGKVDDGRLFRIIYKQACFFAEWLNLYGDLIPNSSPFFTKEFEVIGTAYEYNGFSKGASPC